MTAACRASLLVLALVALTSSGIFAAPAPTPDVKKATVVEVDCSACKGLGFLPLRDKNGTVGFLFPCPVCQSKGKITTEILPMPAPVKAAARTTVVQEKCSACSGRGTLFVRNGLTGAVQGVVPCHHCDGTGVYKTEILPMPKGDNQ
jgi:DnaJ-class molecular chaperone